MTLGPGNVTNITSNVTSTGVSNAIGELLGDFTFGAYPLIGFVFLAGFVYALWKSNVSLDVGATVMVPTLFVFGKYGLLPGGASTSYGLLLAVGGLFIAGLIKYFGR